MIRVRKAHPILAMGTYTFLQPEKKECLLIHRSLNGQHLICALNLTDKPQSIQLDLAPFKGSQVNSLLSNESFPEITESPYPLDLLPYAYLWLEIS